VKKTMSKWIAALAVVASQNVWATPVTDTVIVDGQEWAQVDLFTNNSWNTINAQCPSGVCGATSTINGWDLDGWTWASVYEVQTLFNTFTGQATVAPGAYSEANSAWAPQFLAVFDATFLIPGVSVGTFGWTRDALSLFVGRKAYVREAFTAVNDLAVTNDVSLKEDELSGTGGWFFRDANTVPTPATLSLFGLGLGSMWISRRKKHAAKV
jgi:hypothetical protein